MYSIEIDSISKHYGNAEILKNISFKVKKGEIHGLLGPNGAGKTTTMKLLANLEKPSAGIIKINNTPLEKFDNSLYQKIGILLEEPPLYLDMTLVDYLKYSLKLKKIKEDTTQLIEDVLEKLDLKHVQNKLIGNLSRGYKQRVGVAQAIVHRPEIVILDEPTIGLDPQAILNMRELISSFRGEYTVLLSSHLLHEMSLICDSVSIISQGEMRYSASLSDLKASSLNKQSIDLEVDKNNFSDKIFEKTQINLIKKEELDSTIKLTLQADTDEEYRPELIKFLVSKNINIYSVSQKNSSLEDFFFEMVENK